MKKRKRLNNKGFTLIELLAVIVILAIVMGISASSILSSINNSRKSSLYSAAQNAANTLNTWITEDAVVSEEGSKMLGDDFVRTTQVGTNADTWICLTKTTYIRNRDKGTGIGSDTDGKAKTSLLKALGINENDVVLGDGTVNYVVPTLEGTSTKEYVIREKGYMAAGDTKKPTCSALRYNTSNGGYEILLVAKNGGKYFVTTDNEHFAFSRAAAYNELITD